MRTAWNITSFLAVVNLLALLMCAGWLWQTGRLDSQRIATIRELLSITIADELQTRTEEAAAMEAQEQLRDEERRRTGWPVAGGELIARIDRFEDHAALMLRRVQDENSKLMSQLDAREQDLVQREQQLEARQQQWLASIEADADRRQDEQFLKAVRILESLPPKQARQAIQSLVETGKTEQAVAYLNAMNARSAAKIVREFKTDADVALATDLLEKLRTFGLVAGLDTEIPDEDAAAQPVEPSA
jgi:hypothetical protein